MGRSQRQRHLEIYSDYESDSGEPAGKVPSQLQDTVQDIDGSGSNSQLRGITLPLPMNYSCLWEGGRTNSSAEGEGEGTG